MRIICMLRLFKIDRILGYYLKFVEHMDNIDRLHSKNSIAYY